MRLNLPAQVGLTQIRRTLQHCLCCMHANGETRAGGGSELSFRFVLNTKINAERCKTETVFGIGTTVIHGIDRGIKAMNVI